MAFNRPTLEELVQRVSVDIETTLSVAGARLRNFFVTLFGKVVAGVAHLLHGHLEYISRQIFPQTADSENLAIHADIYGLSKEAGTFAERVITIEGVDGITIDAETELTTSDGVTFRTLSDVTISSGSATVTARATTSGEIGNAAVGTILTFINPIAGVTGEAEVTAVGVDGEDEESDESLLDRLLDRIQTPPLGGTQHDYETWAKQVNGVTRAWAKPLYLGAGTVATFFVRDGESPIFPSVAEVSEVSAYIESVKPIGAHSYVFSPTADLVNMTIELNPDTATIRANVQEELEDLFFRESGPGETILLSHINEAISIASEENDHILYQPSANFTSPNGKMPMLGTITWA